MIDICNSHGQATRRVLLSLPVPAVPTGGCGRKTKTSLTVAQGGQAYVLDGSRSARCRCGSEGYRLGYRRRDWKQALSAYSAAVQTAYNAAVRADLAASRWDRCLDCGRADAILRDSRGHRTVEKAGTLHNTLQQVASELARGHSQHQRLSRVLRPAAAGVVAICDIIILLTFLAGVLNVDWVSPMKGKTLIALSVVAISGAGLLASRRVAVVRSRHSAQPAPTTPAQQKALPFRQGIGHNPAADRYAVFSEAPSNRSPSSTLAGRSPRQGRLHARRPCFSRPPSIPTGPRCLRPPARSLTKSSPQRPSPSGALGQLAETSLGHGFGLSCHRPGAVAVPLRRTPAALDGSAAKETGRTP